MLGQDPNFSLERGDRLVLYSLDGVVDAVQVDVLDALLRGLCGHHQSLVVLFLEDPSEFRVGVKFIAEVFRNGLEPIFRSKERVFEFVVLAVSTSLHDPLELVLGLIYGCPWFPFLVPGLEIETQIPRIQEDLAVFEFLSDSSLGDLSNEGQFAQSLRSSLLVLQAAFGLDGPFCLCELREVLEVLQHSLLGALLGEVYQFLGHFGVGRQEDLQKIDFLLLLFSEGVPLLVELLDLPEYLKVEVVREHLLPVEEDVHDVEMVPMNELQDLLDFLLALPVIKGFQQSERSDLMVDPLRLVDLLFVLEILSHLRQALPGIFGINFEQAKISLR